MLWNLYALKENARLGYIKKDNFHETVEETILFSTKLLTTFVLRIPSVKSRINDMKKFIIICI